MGGARVAKEVLDLARELGERIADQGWALLTGGRDAGVMRAAAEGAKSRDGLTIGILPGDSRDEANAFIDIPIVTNLGDARNVVNVLSSDVVVALTGGAGTLSEIALALKSGKKVCLLNRSWCDLFATYEKAGQIHRVETAEQCISWIRSEIETPRGPASIAE